MGYTNTTSHYSLPQYVATDKPKYLTDFNQTMEAIDTQMYTNAQAAATADGKAVAAKNVADGAVSSIGTLNTQINGDVSDPSDRGLAGDVSDNSGAINTINSLIGNGIPTTTDKTIIGAINEIYADITGGGTDVTAANVSYDNTTSGLTADDVQEAVDEVAGEIGDLSSLDTTAKTSLVAAINEVAQSGGADVDLTTEHAVGKIGNDTVYERLYTATGAHSSTFVVDADAKDFDVISITSNYGAGGAKYPPLDDGTNKCQGIWDPTNGIRMYLAGAATLDWYSITVRYTK